MSTTIPDPLPSPAKALFNKDVEKYIENGINVKLRLFNKHPDNLIIREDIIKSQDISNDDGTLDKSGDMRAFYKLASSVGLTSPPAENNTDWYYAVYIPPEARCAGESLSVYADKVEALKMLKQSKKARFKQFRSEKDAIDFAQNGSEVMVSHGQTGGGEKPASFKGPKPQDLVQFRKAIEAGDYGAVETSINENPRYLVSSGDTPSILQEGCRYNALHVAAKANQPAIAELILNSVENLTLLSRLYDDNDEIGLKTRSGVLLDLYLNTPDKSGNETPLHFAAKYGAADVVELLTSYRQCQRGLVNKFGATPKDVVCSRANDEGKAKKQAILEMLDERFFLPVLRYEDNSMPARLGEPFSPVKPLEIPTSPLSPRIEMPAYAGPMSLNQVSDFVKKWNTKRNVQEGSQLRFTDPEKGHERFARALAHDARVPWREYWPFLDTYLDLSTPEGLAMLENYLGQRFDDTYREMLSPTVETPDEALSPMSALCQTLQACNLNDNNNSIPGKDAWTPRKLSDKKNVKRIKDEKKHRREKSDMNLRYDDVTDRTDDHQNFSSILCVERSCQVFGKRLVNGMLMACSTADVNSMDSGCEHLRESLEPEIKRLQVLVNSYLQDPRFQSVSFRVVHSRVAAVAVSIVRHLLTPSEKTILTSCLRAIAIADGTVSDDEDILFSSRSDDQSSLGIVLKTHLMCLTERLLTELCVAGGASEVGSVQSETECYVLWAQAAGCACDWEPYTHQARARAAWRRHKIVPKILSFTQEDEPNVDEWRSCEEPSQAEEEVFETPPSSPTLSSCSSDSYEVLYDSADETLSMPDTFIYPGDAPSKTDLAVIDAISECTISPGSYPNIYRWRHLVQLYRQTPREQLTHTPGTPIERPTRPCATPGTPLFDEPLMLCGELIRTSPLSINGDATRSPYFTLLALQQGMADILPDDDDIYLENGQLSYENPNYHLDPARLDDALNSNVEDGLYEEILNELSLGLARHGVGGGEARKGYASLDITQMGVDVHTGPVTTLNDNRSLDASGDTTLDNAVHFNNLNMGRRPRNKPDLIEEAEFRHKETSNVASPKSTIVDGIPHIPGDLNEDLYAVPVKNAQPPSHQPDTPDKDQLPPGWERHEDNEGPYYWHIKSGTIQREPPKEGACEESEKELLLDIDKINSENAPISTVTRSTTSSALDVLLRKEDAAIKRRSYPVKLEAEVKERPIRFAVRSLGWVEIAEDDLTPERSSKAVNKCIVDLSLGRNDLLDVVGRWGDGKDLYMDLDEGALKLIDPEKLTVLNTQPIHTIRVWGVGRDNGRDFAYVARDRASRKHMCHVFRCDIPARTIANTLRDICKKIMIERNVHQNLAKPVDLNGCGRSGFPVRPTNLPTEHRRQHRTGPPVGAQSFPTPMEEPKKVLLAQYLGSTQVTKAAGMDVLNEAIQRLSETPKDTWTAACIAVAPSMISITQAEDESQLICECRVRFLSFMGIGENMKLCGYIMHTAQDIFVAHVFYCEPSSGALCKTIEAACKLRYQKCLDAHPQDTRAGSSGSQTPGKGLGATIKSLVGSITGRKAKSTES